MKFKQEHNPHNEKTNLDFLSEELTLVFKEITKDSFHYNSVVRAGQRGHSTSESISIARRREYLTKLEAEALGVRAAILIVREELTKSGKKGIINFSIAPGSEDSKRNMKALFEKAGRLTEKGVHSYESDLREGLPFYQEDTRVSAINAYVRQLTALIRLQQ